MLNAALMAIQPRLLHGVLVTDEIWRDFGEGGTPNHSIWQSVKSQDCQIKSRTCVYDIKIISNINGTLVSNKTFICCIIKWRRSLASKHKFQNDLRRQMSSGFPSVWELACPLKSYQRLNLQRLHRYRLQCMYVKLEIYYCRLWMRHYPVSMRLTFLRLSSRPVAYGRAGGKGPPNGGSGPHWSSGPLKLWPPAIIW